MVEEELRGLIIESLKHQGFRVQDSHIFPSADLDKQGLRNLHALAVQHRVDRAKRGLNRYEPRLLTRIAAGSQVIPECIVPRLVEVRPDSEEDLLFRYACLHYYLVGKR